MPMYEIKVSFALNLKHHQQGELKLSNILILNFTMALAKKSANLTSFGKNIIAKHSIKNILLAIRQKLL